MGKETGGQRREEEMGGGRVKGREKGVALSREGPAQRLVIPVGRPQDACRETAGWGKGLWRPHQDDGH